MNPAVPALLITHRGYGRGLLDAARAILGDIPQIDLLENEGLSPQVLEAEVNAWLDAHPGPVVLLTDLGFGSCSQAARLSCRNRAEVSIVAGVNLPMLLALVRGREHVSSGDLAAHLEARGRESIQVFHGGRPA